MATGRNAPCPCGSGRRYKHCCGTLALPAAAAPAAASPLAAARTFAAPLPGDLAAVVALIDQGRLTEAERGARALLQTDPNSGALWKVLSIVLLRQGADALPALCRAAELLPADSAVQIAAGNTLCGHGREREAVGFYERALALEPRQPEALNNLGNALQALGECRRAAECYRQALAIGPDDAQVQGNLGNALRQLGQLEEAVHCYRRAVDLAPGTSLAHNNLGLALAALGRREEAAASLRHALQLDSRSPGARQGLANVLREAGAHGEALALFRQAVELDPQRAEGHCDVGGALYEIGRIAEAIEAYRRALALRPEHLPAHVGLARALRLRGDTTAAEASCRAALALDPKCVAALSLLADLHADRGEFTRAQDLLAEALALDPGAPATYCSIAAARRMTRADRAWLEGVEVLLARGQPPALEVGLRYALGKYHDDIGEYDAAFSHFRRANELRRRQGPGYDPEDWSRQVERMIALFDAASLRAADPGASSSQRPVFVIGMPRSGTTLVEQILASHPQAFGAGEISFWDRAYEAYAAASAPHRTRTVQGIARDYLARLGASAGETQRVVDKMPANFLYAGLIHAVFPEAKILHVQRHPLDTCLSIYFHNLADMRACRDLEALAHYYAGYLRVSAHWRAVLPATTLLEIPYEGLVDDAERWTRRMLEFLGLPWDPRCLEFHRSQRVVLTASRWQVRQQMNSGSVGRWRNYRRHIGPLRPLLSAAGMPPAAAEAPPAR